MTVAELIEHLKALPDQDAPMMIRQIIPCMGEYDYDPAGIVELFSGTYSIAPADVFGHCPRVVDKEFTAWS